MLDVGRTLHNPSAPHGHDQRYARPERERRFLLRGIPAGEVEKTAHILDRYLLGTRLRVRRKTEVRASGTRTFYKLTQKVPAPEGGPGLLTTIYLDDEEYLRLATLPAAVLEKTRYSIGVFGVDEFGPPLQGLFIAEAEFGSDEEMLAFEAPPFAVVEVTRDPRFTGGSFVRMTSGELGPLLAEFGIGG